MAGDLNLGCPRELPRIHKEARVSRVYSDYGGNTLTRRQETVLVSLYTTANFCPI